jgi:hypothetical protein
LFFFLGSGNREQREISLSLNSNCMTSNTPKMFV